MLMENHSYERCCALSCTKRREIKIKTERRGDMAKILLVDDSPLVLRMVGDLLRAEGYQVVTASSGVEAIMVAQKELPDLIILDIMMPGIDGHHVSRMLKFDKKFANVPVITFSSLPRTAEESETSMSVGASAHLSKSAPPEEIVRTVRTKLARCGKS